MRMMRLRVGDELPEVLSPAIDRLRIAYMAVAMRDPNLVHVEDDFAVRSGLPGVIAHGTFVLAYAGAAVGRALGVDAIRRLKVDLTAPVFPGDILTTKGRATAVEREDGGDLVTLALTVEREDGVAVGRGSATVFQATSA